MVLFKIWLKDFEVTILVKTLHIIQKKCTIDYVLFILMCFLLK
jgi:hypothetical protein